MAGLPNGSAMVGVPIVLSGSNASCANSGSAVTATPGHPLLFRIKLPLLFVVLTVPVLLLPVGSEVLISKQSFEPFRERIVLWRENDACAGTPWTRGKAITTTPPPAWLSE